MPMAVPGFPAVHRRRCPALLLVMVVGAASAGRPLAAQIRFELGDTAVRMERYTAPEECLALVKRVRRTLAENSAVLRDTLPHTPADGRAPLPPPVVDAAQRCGARFDTRTTPLADYLSVLKLSLFAERDADAGALAARRLQAIKQTGERERAAVLDTVLAVYLGPGDMTPLAQPDFLDVQPPRIAMAEPFVKALAGMQAASWKQRHEAYFRLLQAVRAVGDSTRLRWAAEGVVATVAAIPSADQRTAEYSAYVQRSFQAMGLLARDSLLDSLRRSTASYVALQRAHWAKASGERPEALQMPIGQPAPTVQGDFWSRRGDVATSRPSKGKIALVAFVDHAEASGVNCVLGAACDAASAALHRVAERFPEVEVTLVARTRGYFSEAGPLAPAAEADTLAHWWLTRHDLPGALAVTATDFWRLPEPDRRRIDRDRPNEVSYSFGRHWPVKPLSAYLVDRDGVIVGVVNLTERNASEELAKLVDAIRAQPLASR